MIKIKIAAGAASPPAIVRLWLGGVQSQCYRPLRAPDTQGLMALERTPDAGRTWQIMDQNVWVQ